MKADNTDHIIRIEEGGDIWSDDNYMPLSNFWHNRKSRLEQMQGTLGLDYVESIGGKVPKDRNQVIDILKQKFWKDVQDYKDGFRT